jgi:hypothetical protein
VFAGTLWSAQVANALLAMQKVEGSNPFSRFGKGPYLQVLFHTRGGAIRDKAVCRHFPIIRTIGLLFRLLVRSPDAIQGFVFMTVFPLTFLSNAFLPAARLPDGRRAVAEWNTVGAVVAAVRSLFGNPTAAPADAAWPLDHPVLAATLWTGLFLAVSIPLTIRRFRSRTTE